MSGQRGREAIQESPQIGLLMPSRYVVKFPGYHREGAGKLNVVVTYRVVGRRNSTAAVLTGAGEGALSMLSELASVFLWETAGGKLFGEIVDSGAIRHCLARAALKKLSTAIARMPPCGSAQRHSRAIAQIRAYVHAYAYVYVPVYIQSCPCVPSAGAADAPESLRNGGGNGRQVDEGLVGVGGEGRDDGVPRGQIGGAFHLIGASDRTGEG
ncbi:MAG: hypothetical protein JWL81_1421 [Verrucomicrobiales bacterium]|nr:hypothetical protein [Verrucomicrobiales bacterium]